MALSMKDLHWAAGFLEGEGSFCTTRGKRPDGRLRAAWDVKMDAGQNCVETLLRLQNIFGGYVYPKTKTCVSKWHLNGRTAVGAMMTLWTLMSKRRRKQIEQTIERWKSNQEPNGKNQKKYVPRGEYHPFVKLTNRQVANIRKSKRTAVALGKMYDVNSRTIGKIRRNESRIML
jgi:hypothetical protein